MNECGSPTSSSGEDHEFSSAIDLELGRVNASTESLETSPRQTETARSESRNNPETHTAEASPSELDESCLVAKDNFRDASREDISETESNALSFKNERSRSSIIVNPPSRNRLESDWSLEIEINETINQSISYY